MFRIIVAFIVIFILIPLSISNVDSASNYYHCPVYCEKHNWWTSECSYPYPDGGLRITSHRTEQNHKPFRHGTQDWYHNCTNQIFIWSHKELFTAFWDQVCTHEKELTLKNHYLEYFEQGLSLLNIIYSIIRNY